MSDITKCSECNKKIEYDGLSSLCDDCRRKSNTKKYSYIGIIILIIGFIEGIVMGNIGKTTVIVDSETKEYFNTTLMFFFWNISLFISLILFGLSSICYRLDLIVDKKSTK